MLGDIAEQAVFHELLGQFPHAVHLIEIDIEIVGIVMLQIEGVADFPLGDDDAELLIFAPIGLRLEEDADGRLINLQGIGKRGVDQLTIDELDLVLLDRHAVAVHVSR